MLDETVQKAAIVASSDNDELQLTSRERALIRNFRAMRDCAKDMMVDLSEQYRRTLPLAPTQLRLVGSAEKV